MDLVNQTLGIREQQAVAKTNADQVAQQFTNQYGDQAEATYNSIAKDLGLSVPQLNELAAKSPKVVLKAAGLETTTAPVAKSTGSINTEALNNQNKSVDLSARVESGSTKDLLKAWGNAKAKVNQQS